MRIILICLLIIVFTCPAPAQVAAQADQPAADTEIKGLVQNVTAGAKSSEEKIRKLVKWINTNFTWSYTDYRKRTVKEIIERRAGNCAELSNVLAAMLTEGGIRFRWISEINIQPRKEDRLQTAMEKVKSAGNRMSVFGLMHNDHVWLEIFDDKNNSWFPADPAVGVVGMKEWISARMAFKQRLISPIPEIAKVVEEMLVPILVVAKEKRSSKPTEDRTRFYVIDGFNNYYRGRLAKLPSWKAWSAETEALAPFGAGAFAGEVNFHDHQKEIERVWQIYQDLRKEAASLK